MLSEEAAACRAEAAAAAIAAAESEAAVSSLQEKLLITEQARACMHTHANAREAPDHRAGAHACMQMEMRVCACECACTRARHVHAMVCPAAVRAAMRGRHTTAAWPQALRTAEDWGDDDKRLPAPPKGNKLSGALGGRRGKEAALEEV